MLGHRGVCGESYFPKKPSKQKMPILFSKAVIIGAVCSQLGNLMVFDTVLFYWGKVAALRTPDRSNDHLFRSVQHDIPSLEMTYPCHVSVSLLYCLKHIHIYSKVNIMTVT